jgi:hypothetical protein
MEGCFRRLVCQWHPHNVYFAAAESAFAVALMIASDVIVAPLVASTPLTPFLEMILAVVSEMEE